MHTPIPHMFSNPWQTWQTLPTTSPAIPYITSTRQGSPKVAHHHHWWVPSLGPPCFCYFLCGDLHFSVAHWAHLLFYFIFGFLVSAKLSGKSDPDLIYASGAASLHAAVSGYDGDSFYDTLHSLFIWGRMTVFTAHKWSSVHISGDILERRCIPFGPPERMYVADFHM